MVHKSRSENFLVDEKKGDPKKKEKQLKYDDFHKKICRMDNVIKNLEASLMESNHYDHQLIIASQRDDMKNQKLVYQLEEARKENKQLLNVLQQQCNDQNTSRSTTRGQLDHAPSYSTISMVHLQYKYEELLASHEGLLKVLESKIKESQKCYKENDDLRDEVQKYIIQTSNNESTIKTLCNKYLHLKQRKDKKIENLRYERDTLRLVHNQLVNLLHKKCMDEDNFLSIQLQNSLEPTKALLLSEIKLCNKLQHENARLQQENKILKSRLGVDLTTKN